MEFENIYLEQNAKVKGCYQHVSNILYMLQTDIVIQL